MIKTSKINSLSFQISIVIIVTLLSASIAFAWWFSYRLTESNKTLKVEETIALGKSLSSSIVLDLTDDNFVAIEQLLLKTQDFSNISKISVVNADGLKISEVARNSDLMFETTFNVEKVSRPNSYNITRFESKENIVIWVPLSLGVKNLGWITIQLDYGFLQQLNNEHLATMCIASFVISLLSLIAIYIFLRPRLAALATATQFANRLSQSYGDTMVSNLGSFELDALANALNSASINLLLKDKQINEKHNLLLASNYDLEERVKELNGIYSMSRILNDSGKKIDEKLQNVVELLPSAWQFPSITSCRIIYQGTSFISIPFTTSEYNLTRDVVIDNKNVGNVAIFYAEYPGDYDIGPFLDEEKFLLEEVAVSLGNFLKQYQIQRELEKMNENLEAKVKERTLKLEAAIVEAEEANSAKTEFLSRMSHELRTPMNAIMGFASLLQIDQKHPLTDKQQGNVKYILDASEHLMKLINEILEISRIEEGAIDLSPKKISTQTVIGELVPMFFPMANEKNISINFDPNANGLATVTLDVARFKQIMINLLSNAIKYNLPNGRVEIRIEDTSDQRQEISVADTGVGMNPEDLKIIFDPFKRLKLTEAQEGSGIGLAVVKLLVELMGGEIKVTSTLGKGSTFKLIFPAS